MDTQGCHAVLEFFFQATSNFQNFQGNSKIGPETCRAGGGATHSGWENAQWLGSGAPLWPSHIPAASKTGHRVVLIRYFASPNNLHVLSDQDITVSTPSTIKYSCAVQPIKFSRHTQKISRLFWLFCLISRLFQAWKWFLKCPGFPGFPGSVATLMFVLSK